MDKERIVYLLEDDESICELIECAFMVNKINIMTFQTIKAFYQAIQNRLPDIVLLDIMLSDGNGLDVLKDLKDKYHDLYCIMISALGKETDKVKGLNMGADDYIAKPFGILELTAKINAVFRRLKSDDNITIIKIDNIEINKKSMIVKVNDEVVELNNKEYQLLLYFVTNIGIVLSRESLLINIWGYDFGETRTLDNYIAHLRKLGISNIETIFGVGYRYMESK